MISRCCVRPTLEEVVFENNPSDHKPWSIHKCHVGIHVDFTSILHSSHTPLVPHSKREWSRAWTTGSAFSTNESAWSVIMVTGSQSRVWSGPWSPTPSWNKSQSQSGKSWPVPISQIHLEKMYCKSLWPENDSTPTDREPTHGAPPRVFLTHIWSRPSEAGPSGPEPHRGFRLRASRRAVMGEIFGHNRLGS